MSKKTKTGKASKAADKPSTAPKRMALLVLSMHRSGSSAMSGVLSKLGFDLPETLLPPAADNPKGYFESRASNRLNDALLASAGSNWHDWREVNPDWMRSPRAAEFHEQARQMIRDEFGESTFFLVKDPRISRLVPFWTDVLRAEGCAPMAVLTHRNPLDVASSIEEREGWPRDYGLLLWLRHVLDAEVGSRDLPRHFTSYDRLLDNWAGTVNDIAKSLGIAYPRSPETVQENIEKFLTRDLQHFDRAPSAALDNPLLSDWIRITYDILENWAESGERKGDRAKLDKVRKALNAAAPAFASLAQSAQRAPKAKADRDKIAAEKKTLDDRIAALKKQSETSKADLEAARARAAELEKRQKQLVQERDKLTGELKTAKAAPDNSAELAAARAKVAELTRISTERAERMESLKTERNNQKIRADRFAEEMEKAKARAEKAETERRALDEAAKAQAEAEKARKHELDALKAELGSARRKADELETQQQESLDEVVRLADRLQETERDKAHIQSALEQRSHEAQQVGQALREAEKARDDAKAQSEADRQEIARLTAALDEARKGAEHLEDKMTQNDRALTSLKADLAARMRADMDRELENDPNSAISEARRALAERDQKIAQLELERAQQLEHLRHELDGRIAQLRQERDGFQAQIDAQIAETEAMAARMADLQVEYDQTRAQLEQAKAGQNDERKLRKSREADLQSYRAEKEQMDAQRQEMQDRIAYLEEAHEALLKSGSWKLTAPLRKLLRVFRRG